ncbi:hypothetical protein ABFA07_004786 [Porites harrisoni]
MESKSFKRDPRKQQTPKEGSDKAIVRATRRFSIMEERREDTFYTELRREWRSGSIAVMADSFKTLPGIVS